MKVHEFVKKHGVSPVFTAGLIDHLRATIDDDLDEAVLLKGYQDAFGRSLSPAPAKAAEPEPDESQEMNSSGRRRRAIVPESVPESVD